MYARKSLDTAIYTFMSELPPDIHGEIVSHILPDEETSDRDCTATLATLRLVSKSFHSSATPSLFETYRVDSGNDPPHNRFLHDLYRKDVAALALARFVKHVVIVYLTVSAKTLRIYLQAIQGMPNLIKISLSQIISPEYVEWFATLPALQNLSLYACGFSDSISRSDESTLQMLTTICRRTLKEYGPQGANYFDDPVFRILTSGNIPSTTLKLDSLGDTDGSFVALLESLPTIVNLTINRHIETFELTPPLRVLSPKSMPNLRFLKCPSQILPIFTRNHLESLRWLDLTGLYEIYSLPGTPPPNVRINPFSVILPSLEELTVSISDFLAFHPESQTTFATNLPRLNTLITKGWYYKIESDRLEFYNHIDRLIASFSPPNEVREFRFQVLGSRPTVDLLREREMISKIIKGPFPRLRKVAFSFLVTWVKESIVRVARAGESDTKQRLDDWRPFIPRSYTSISSPFVNESIKQVSDYVQVQSEAASGLTS